MFESNRAYVVEIIHEVAMPLCPYVKINGWDGLAYKIRRKDVVGYCETLPDLKKAGCYILCGDEQLGVKQMVYVGRSSGNIRSRLLDHLNKEFFWKEVIVFVNKTDDLFYDQWMEGKIFNLLKFGSRCQTDNRQVPKIPHYDKKVSILVNEYLKFAIIATGALDQRIFLPLKRAERSPQKKLTELELKKVQKFIPEEEVETDIYGKTWVCRTKGSNARAIFHAAPNGKDIIVEVLASSFTTQLPAPPSFETRNAAKVIKDLLKKGILIEHPSGAHELTQNYTFYTPTLASEIFTRVGGSGMSCWRDEETNFTVTEIKENKVTPKDNKIPTMILVNGE